MRRSGRLAEKRAKAENEAHMESKAKKKRSNEKTSNIVTIDSDTMVEVFKYLNYCQLAKNSLVSNRFWNLIRTHRHKLALLYVDYISMNSIPIAPVAIKVFDKELFDEEYNEWIIRNNYSKQIPLDDEVAENTKDISNGYRLNAYAHFKDPNNRGWNHVTSVFFAQVELNHDSWPAFQHFVRLLTDPFIYLDRVHLSYQIDVLNLLSGTFNTNRRLQCKQLYFDLNGNSQKSISWTKNHVRCNQFHNYGDTELDQDKALLDFFVTGGYCTPSIEVKYRDLSKASVDFVQKFMNLKTSDESQFVESIEGIFKAQILELLNRDYAEFFVKEERNDRSNTHIFEFVNDNIGKKLQLTIENRRYSFVSKFLIKN
ncbi:hypothetical protein DdX_18795 [Ditylenchus destructor]|uniref:F-box domain-containing protein n=1 Tax=Ditylenchus destructor TaxID=166010 RepID=A0AAD4MIY8_9BILA|nr:hypothetical protein DdX_18795 [Ditylenchus destructor]